MREIKYRAWDRTKKRWLSDKDTWMELANRALKPERRRNWIEIVESSGLADAKGREIYEGHILNSLYRKSGCKGIYVIYWHSGGLRISRKGKHQQEFVTISMNDLSFCEIIGNIFEHEKLLNQKRT